MNSVGERGFSTVESSFLSSNDSIDIDAKPWILDIRDKDVLCDGWKCFLTFMIETDATFHGVMDLVNTAMASGKRKKVKVINIEKIQQVALDHCFNTGERTPFSALCELVKRTGGPRFLEKIPVDLLAYMIKYIINYERERYIKEQERIAKLKYRAGARYVSIALDYDYKITFSTTTEGEIGGEDEEEEEEEEENVKVMDNKEVPRTSRGTVRKSRTSTRASKKKTVMKTPEESEEEDSSELDAILKNVEDILNVNFEKFKRRKMKKELMEKLKNMPREKLKKILKICTKRKKKQSENDSEKESLEEQSISSLSSSTSSLSSSETFAKIGEKYKHEKMDTLLHKRGEPVRDVYTFDDSPPNGPNMYIFINSLKESNLPEVLSTLDVSIHAYIFIGKTIPKGDPRINDGKVIASPSRLDEPFDNYMKNFGNYFSFLSAVALERYASKNYLEPFDVYQQLKNDITDFHISFFKKVVDKRTYKLYQDVIMTRYLPDVSELNLMSSKWIKNLKDLLYSETSKSAYYFYKVYLLYKLYQRKMKCKDLTVPGRLPRRRMHYYKTFLDKVPNDIITIPLIVDTIIAQVCVIQKAYIGYDLEKYKTKPRRHEQPVENIMEETIKSLRKEYFPGLQPKVHKYVETRCLLWGDLLGLKTHRLSKLGKLIRNRCTHILKIYFKNQWNRYVPEIDDETEEFNSNHFETLEKACKSMNIESTRTVLKLFLNIMSLACKTNEKSKEDSNSASNIIKTSIDRANLSKCPSTQTIQSNYSELMKALVTLKDRIRHAKDDIDESLLSLSTSDDINCKVPSYIEDICNMDENELKQLLQTIAHYEYKPKRTFLQALWDTLQDRNSIKVHYVPFTHSLIYIGRNDSINIEENGTLPTRMSLGEFFKIGMTELKDWCKDQEKFIKDHLSKGLFFTEIDKLKDNIVDPIKPVRVTPSMTLTDVYFTLPRRYRELIGQKQKNPLCPFRNKNLVKVTRKKKQKVKPSLYYFGTTKRVKLFSNIREFCFNNSSIISFKINVQMYHTPELTINIKQDTHDIIFHTELTKNNKEKRLLLSHSSGMKISFYESIEEKFSWSTLKEQCGEYISDHKTNEEKSYAEEYAEETEASRESVKEIEETLKAIFKTENVAREKKRIIDEILPIKDPNGELGAKFKCKFSYPSGLHAETIELEDENFSYIKQSYIIKSAGEEAILNEKSRLFLRNGTVIKIIGDKLLPEIFYPCGRWIKYSKFNYSNLLFRNEEEEEDEEFNINKKKSTVNEEVNGEEEIFDEYYLFEPDGSYYKVTGEQMILLEKKRYQECIDIFRNTRTILMSDGPTFYFDNECLQTVTFLDGTKINTYIQEGKDDVFCEWTKKELKRWFQGEWSLDEEWGEYEGEYGEERSGDPYTNTYNPDNYRYSTSNKADGSSSTKFQNKAKKAASKAKTNRLSTSTATGSNDVDDGADYSDDDKDDKDIKTPTDYYRYDDVEEEEEQEEEGGEAEIIDEYYGEYEQHDRYLDKIDLAKDGFVWIKTVYVIEHPYYASVFLDCNETGFILKDNVFIYQRDNGCMDLIALPGLQLLLRYDEIIVNHSFGKDIIQRSMLFYKVFETLSPDKGPEVIFVSIDKDGNSVIADSSGDIEWKKVNELLVGPIELDYLKNLACNSEIEITPEVIKPPYLNDSSRRLIMNYDFNGLELDTKTNFERFIYDCSDTGEITTIFEEEPFFTHAYLYPYDCAFIKWIKNYSIPEKKLLYEFPSTYGDSWLFPFKLKKKKKHDLPELMLAKYVNKFKYENIDEIFQDVIKEYLSILSNFLEKKKFKGVQLKKTECIFPDANYLSKMRDEALKLRTKLMTRCQVTLKLEKMKLYKIRNLTNKDDKKIVRKFRFKRKYSWLYFKKKIHDIYSKNYVPYFESGPGVAFLVIDEIMNRVIMVIDILGLKDQIEELLDKPMRELTEENLQHIQMYLELFYEQLNEKEDLNVERILRAAVKLADYFPNMRHALQLRVNYEGQYTVEKYCELLKYGDKNLKQQKEILDAASDGKLIDSEEMLLRQTIAKYLGDNCNLGPK